MAIQFKVKRLQFYLKTINNFFGQFQEYLSRTLDTEPLVIMRIQNNIDFQNALMSNNLAKRFLFYTINNYGSLGERTNSEGTIGESATYTDSNISIFYIGMDREADIAELLSYSIYEDLDTFVKEKGGVTVLDNPEFEGRFMWQSDSICQVKGSESFGKDVPLDIWTNYSTQITPRITIHLK